MAELGLLQVDNLAATALAAAVLPHHAADPPLGCPVTLLHNRDGPAAAFRAQKFPSARPYGFAVPAARASPRPALLMQGVF